MKWNEVKVETASEAVEAVANILMEAGASGVAIEDALDVENFVPETQARIFFYASCTWRLRAVITAKCDARQ